MPNNKYETKTKAKEADDKKNKVIPLRKTPTKYKHASANHFFNECDTNDTDESETNESYVCAVC